MLAAALVGRGMGVFRLTTHCGGGGGLKADFEAIALGIVEQSRDNRCAGSGSGDGDGTSDGSGRPNQLSARSWRQAMIRSLFASTAVFSSTTPPDSSVCLSLRLSCFFLMLYHRHD